MRFVFSLLHLKTGSTSSLFVFVSQECESAIKNKDYLLREQDDNHAPVTGALGDREEKKTETRRREINTEWSELE